jgi:hypothetical protein
MFRLPPQATGKRIRWTYILCKPLVYPNRYAPIKRFFRYRSLFSTPPKPKGVVYAFFPYFTSSRHAFFHDDWAAGECQAKTNLWGKESPSLG